MFNGLSIDRGIHCVPGFRAFRNLSPCCGIANNAQTYWECSRRRVCGRVSASDIDAPPQAEVDSIEDRVRYITNKSQLEHELNVAGDRLVVLELMADNACETGLFEAEDHWTRETEQRKKRMDACATIRHSYVEMAADSPDTRFLAVMEDESNLSDISQSLGISGFPSVVFFKHGRVVWQAYGSDGMYSDMAEGLLYFGAAHMDRKDSVDSISDLHTHEDVNQFINAETPAKLKMLMVTTDLCSPCVHIFPPFLTLAMNFRDLIDFGRVGAEDDEMAALCKSLNIREVPTFIAFCDGKEVDRLVSGNRGDLVGHLLALAMRFGIDPPRPA